MNACPPLTAVSASLLYFLISASYSQSSATIILQLCINIIAYSMVQTDINIRNGRLSCIINPSVFSQNGVVLSFLDYSTFFLSVQIFNPKHMLNYPFPTYPPQGFPYHHPFHFLPDQSTLYYHLTSPYSALSLQLPNIMVHFTILNIEPMTITALYIVFQPIQLSKWVWGWKIMGSYWEYVSWNRRHPLKLKDRKVWKHQISQKLCPALKNEETGGCNTLHNTFFLAVSFFNGVVYF